MKRILDKASSGMMAVSCTALGLCVAANAYEIFMRYLFAKSLYWIQDFTLLCMLWFIFPGMVKVANKGNDIAVEVLVNALPKALQRILAVAVDLLVTVFSLMLFYFSLEMFRLRIGQVKVTSLIPLNCYTLAITISMFLMSLVYIEKMVRQFTERRNNP